MSYERNETSGEIFKQLYFLNRYILNKEMNDLLEM